MTQRNEIKMFGMLAAVICFCVATFWGGDGISGEGAALPKMPVQWTVISDYQLPAQQVRSISSKLGAGLSGIRNTVYRVKGKRVQLNVIAATDQRNAERLMRKLRSMKAEEALLQKGLLVYEFVGPNEVLPLIAEGRKYLQSN